MKVTVEEPESNAKLCGPACANEIFVHDGSILGVPDAEKWKQVRTEGISTGITYLSAVAALAAARIEEAARCRNSTVVQVKMAKLPSDINLKIDEFAMRAVTDNNKKVDVRGPVFLVCAIYRAGIIFLYFSQDFHYRSLSLQCRFFQIVLEIDNINMHRC